MKRSLRDSFAVNCEARGGVYVMRYYPMRCSYSDGVWVRRDDEIRDIESLVEKTLRREMNGRIKPCS